MVNLRDKLLEYFERGYSEFSFFPRRQISGYTIGIEARGENETVQLLYDSSKDRCREKNGRDVREEAQIKIEERFFKK